MRLFGRQLSSWWWLIAIPIAVVGSPVLLILFFAGNNLAGAIFGPPAIWNRPWGAVQQTDLVGHYVETERNSDQPANGVRAEVVLNSDGSMRVTGLPYEFWPKTCIISGAGRWERPEGDHIELQLVTSSNSAGSCEPGPYPAFDVTRRSKPYDLYWIIGDPDSGTGVWLKRQ